MKFEELRRFKKDQYKFNSKLSDVLGEAKPVRALLPIWPRSLERGETLVAERQKHILLGDKSDYGWMVIEEYKKDNIADNFDDERRK